MSTHSRPKGPEDSRTHRLASEAGASGVFIPTSCPGPAGTWPCSLELGHGGDHERFAPETPLKTLVGELSEAIRNLREERDELLLTCADLLAALRDCIGDLEHEEPDGWMSGNVSVSAVRAARAAIKKAEARS